MTIEIIEHDDVPLRMVLLLWGAAGVGKTTFSATAPGKKLWLSFGDQEHVSIMGRGDVKVMPLYKMSFDEMLKHARSENPFGLDNVLAEDTSIETVVCDSLTAIMDASLRKSVALRVGGSKHFTPTLEFPGLSAYGGRNAIALEVIYGLLRVTAKHSVHLIMTAHEADPQKDNDGIVQYIEIMLGGKMINNITWRLSEIWYLSEDEQGRQLAVRPTRKRKPMKTRMFTGKGSPEFTLTYDADRPDKGQMTIEAFYSQWAKSSGKLPIPKSRRDGK